MPAELKELTDSLVTKFVGYDGGPIVVLSDDSSKAIGKSIMESVANTGKGRFAHHYNLDVWRKGEPLTELPYDLGSLVGMYLRGPDQNHNTLLYVFSVLPGEQPMRQKLHEIGEAHGKMGGLPNCTVDVLEAGYHPSNKLEFAEELYDFMLQEEEVQLTCDRGSDLKIIMNHADPDSVIGSTPGKYHFVNSNGVLIPGRYANPIPAEAFAHPVSADGTLVISGSYGPIMGHERFLNNKAALKDALDKNPIYWTIKDGKVTHADCGDPMIRDFVNTEIFEKDEEHGAKIGEFGLPANLYVLARKLTGNLMIDEKGRVHIAHGHGYDVRTGCEYDTPVHGDGLVANADLFSTRLGKKFMIGNVYSSDIFKTLHN